MNRNAVVLSVLIALAAVALWVSALVSAVQRSNLEPTEARAWRRVFAPLAAPALVFVAVLGWAIADPDDCEAIGLIVAVVAAIASLITLRALVRAALSLAPASPILAGTVGILRPTIHISPQLSSRLTVPALAAILAHERAHARHRDPARQLLAQIATDLQWPLPGARQRLIAWRQALELARDDEALRTGASAADLALAIVTGARLAVCAPVDSAVAHALSQGEALSNRVRRLLSDAAPSPPASTSRFAWLVATAALGLSFLFGLTAADEVIEGVLSVLP